MMRNRDWERNAALVRHLVDLRNRIRRLEGSTAESHTARSALTGPTAKDDNNTEPTS